MLQITKGYIQGAFDGEGCIAKSTHGSYESWLISISSTDPVWLESIAKYLKSHGYNPKVQMEGRSNKRHWKQGYSVRLFKRTEIRRFLRDFPPLMAARQKKAAEFLLWDKQYRRKLPKARDNVLQQALDILEGSNNQGRLL